MKEFDIKRFFDSYSKKNRRERKVFLQALQCQGLRITDIACYTYPEAPGIKHVFFYFKREKEPLPYFMLKKETLLKIQDLLNENVSKLI